MRIGCVDRAICLFLPAIVRRYRERYPMVDLTLMELHREPQRDALLRGDPDLGFFALREDDTGFRSELLAVEPLVVMPPDTQPAARR